MSGSVRPSTDGGPPADREEAGGPSDREARLARVALIGVGMAYAAVQLVVVGIWRAPGWDESVYISQVMPDTEAVLFHAWRARGLPLLIAPFALTGSVEAIRLFLTVASATGAAVAFWVWVPLIGLAAPVAAFGFSFSWLALFSGSDVMPNLWAAILGLAAAGLAGRAIEGGRTRERVLAGAALFATALVRPTEAIVVAGAIGLYVLLFRRTSWLVLRPLAIGLVAGWLPWLIEMSLRFGGPSGAVSEAGAGNHFSPAQGYQQLIWHLSYTTSNRRGDVPAAGALWWGILLVMGSLALARGSKGPGRTASMLASFGGLALGAEYIVFVSHEASRFLLPAYAFASVAASVGVVSLLRGKVVSRVAGALVLALAVPWAVWQGAVADRVELRKSARLASYPVVGKELRRAVRGRPCAFVSSRAYPMIQLASGCEGEDIRRRRGPSPAELERLLAELPKQLYVVLPRKAGKRSAARVLAPVRVRLPKLTWFIYPVSELDPRRLGRNEPAADDRAS